MIDGPVYLDANILIYAMETDGDEGLLARRWLLQVDRGRLRAVTSELTMVEVLPQPIALGNIALVQGYRRFFKGSANFSVVPVARAILEAATDLRAKLGSETPDAIHVATALSAGCRSFLTNDGRLRLPDKVIRRALADVMIFYR